MEDCWKWGAAHRESDGRPLWGKRYAYRVLYETILGRIPKGMVSHHLCGNAWCVNPWHVELITQGEHLHRHGLPGDNHQRFKTHCPAGHRYNKKNTYHYKNERRCRICHRAAKKRYLSK